jgi:hypothetical protein
MTVKQVVGTLWGLSILLVLTAGVLVHTSEKRATMLLMGLFAAALLFTVAVSVIPVDEGKGVRENPFTLFLKPSRPSRKTRRQ